MGALLLWGVTLPSALGQRLGAHAADLSRGLRHGADLCEGGGGKHPGGNPSGLDKQYAHKISLVWNPKNETFYLVYNAVPGTKISTGGRGIGLITSQRWRAGPGRKLDRKTAFPQWPNGCCPAFSFSYPAPSGCYPANRSSYPVIYRVGPVPNRGGSVGRRFPERRGAGLGWPRKVQERRFGLLRRGFLLCGLGACRCVSRG